MSSSMSDTKKTVPGESLGIGTKTEMIPAIQHKLLHSCSVDLWRRHVAFPFKIISSVLEESNLNLLVGCTYVVLLLVRDTGWTVWKFCLRRLHGHCMLSKNWKFFKMINSQSRKGSFTSPHFHWFFWVLMFSFARNRSLSLILFILCIFLWSINMWNFHLSLHCCKHTVKNRKYKGWNHEKDCMKSSTDLSSLHWKLKRLKNLVNLELLKNAHC